MTGGVGFRIESLWAYLAIHANDDEGVVGYRSSLGWIPAIAADETRLDELRPTVEGIARITKQEIVLVQFTTRIDHETIR